MSCSIFFFFLLVIPGENKNNKTMYVSGNTEARLRIIVAVEKN
jgi:hypothetical protein